MVGAHAGRRRDQGSIGAFPRVILAEGDYRAIARNDNKTYEGEFRVVPGVDREVEVLEALTR